MQPPVVAFPGSDTRQEPRRLPAGNVTVKLAGSDFTLAQLHIFINCFLVPVKFVTNDRRKMQHLQSQKHNLRRVTQASQFKTRHQQETDVAGAVKNPPHGWNNGGASITAGVFHNKLNLRAQHVMTIKITGRNPGRVRRSTENPGRKITAKTINPQELSGSAWDTCLKG